jgi:hypothetical protein
MTYKLLGACLLCAVLLIACEKKGPLEKAGEAVDNAVEKVGDAAEDATDQ